MKFELILLLVLLIFSCESNPNSELSDASKLVKEENKTPQLKPKVSFTFDDGITKDLAGYKFEDWNEMILAALREESLKSVFFVTGSNKKDTKGKYLLESWSKENHVIANHTYNHPNFNSDKETIESFEKQLIKTDQIISNYESYKKLFRFPYLKEGNTVDKISGFREILKRYNYKNGYVTIDASDWYINGELIKCIKKEGMTSPKIEKYKEYYLQHILERAKYYEELSFELTKRNISHTLLLHHNLTSALFLTDLIEKFKEEGWEILNAAEAFEDKIFKIEPDVVPAGESLIWSIAKETGRYEERLRYPAEDSRYEIPKMKEIGL